MSSRNRRSGPDRKLILLGAANAGKSSMRCMIFLGWTVGDTKTLGCTTSLETSCVEIFDRTCHVIDCPGQAALSQQFMRDHSDTLLSKVDVAIYLLDCNVEDWVVNVEELVAMIKDLARYSPESQIIIMIHKIDLIAGYEQRKDGPEKARVYEANKKAVLERYRKKIREHLERELAKHWAQHHQPNYPSNQSNQNGNSDHNEQVRSKAQEIFDKMVFKMTTIFDESLFRAWADIVSNIDPSIKKYQAKTKEFCERLGADMVTIFESKTHLCLTSYQRQGSQITEEKKVNEQVSQKLREKTRQEEQRWRDNGGQRRGPGRPNFRMRTQKFQLFFREIKPHASRLGVLVVFYLTDKRRRERDNIHVDCRGPSTVLASSAGQVSVPISRTNTASAHSGTSKSTSRTALTKSDTPGEVGSNIPSCMESSVQSNLSNIDSACMSQSVRSEWPTPSHLGRLPQGGGDHLLPAICHYPEVVEVAIREFSDDIRLLVQK